MAHMDPPRAVCVFKLRLQVVLCCCCCCFFAAVKILMNKHLTWFFLELVVLLSNLEEGRNVGTIFENCMVNNELDQ